MIHQGVIRVVHSMSPGRLIDGGQILEAPELGGGFHFKEPEHIFQGFPVNVEGGHVGRVGRLANLVPESLLQRSRQGAVPFIDFNAVRGRGPHEIGPAFEESGGRHGGAPLGRAVVSRTPRIPGLGDPVNEDRSLTSLSPAGSTKYRTERPFCFYLFLKKEQALKNRLRPGRAPGDVQVHRKDLVDSLDDAVDVVHPSAVGAGSHGDNPLGFGHLLVKAKDHRGNFLENRPGGDEKIRLPRGSPQDFGAEPGNVIPGGVRDHLLNKAAGQTEEHGPEAVLAAPVHKVIELGQDKILNIFRRGHSGFFQSRAPFLHT